MTDTHPKGMLGVDAETKARKMLAKILYQSKAILRLARIVDLPHKALLAGDKDTIMRLAEHTFDRHFTVAEQRLLYEIELRTRKAKGGE